MVSLCASVSELLTKDLQDLYGESKPVAKTAANGVTPGSHIPRTRSVIHLSLCDSLPAYGPIADMTFSLAKLGVRIPWLMGRIYLRSAIWSHILWIISFGYLTDTIGRPCL